MIIIGIILAFIGLAYLCWLVFSLAIYALPFFAGASAGLATYHSGSGPLLPGRSPSRRCARPSFAQRSGSSSRCRPPSRDIMPRSASRTSAYLPTIGERPWQLRARSSWQPRLGRAWCSLPRARHRTRHCRRRDTASSADVVGQSRLSPRRSSFRGWLLTEPVSDRHQRVTTARSLQRSLATEAASRWMRHDPLCGRWLAGCRDMESRPSARKGFFSFAP